MAKDLYIIGNGFDLHHKINSSYSDFREWMSGSNPEVLNKVEEIYGYCDREWWSDFENNLASLDVIKFGIRIAFENQPDLMSEHCDRTWNDAAIEVERQLDNIYFNLRECFHEWIKQLNHPMKSQMLRLKTQDAAFLNFNYTMTLENLYGINSHKILHIHGCIDNNEDFVLGHGKSIEELHKINSTKFLTFDSPTVSDNSKVKDATMHNHNMDAYDGLETHEQFATYAAIRGVASQRKPVNKIIETYLPFFETMNDVKQIHVYGLSFSDVDSPYLDYFALNFKHVHWEFNDYKGYTIDKIIKFCQNNALNDYSIIDFKDILDNRQLCIDFQ